MLPDALLTQLRHEARRRDTSIAEVVRQAVERELAEPKGHRKLSFVAIGKSGIPDGAERVDEIVGRAILEEHDQRN